MKRRNWKPRVWQRFGGMIANAKSDLGRAW